MCLPCKLVMKQGLQPLDALANFQYFGIDELPADVKTAFEKSSLYDLMMVSRCRATRITHLFCDKPSSRGFDKVRAFSQGYSKGNVAIFAQDIASVRAMLPPPREEIRDAMCALFIGPSTAPTRDNIKDLRPVLVSKTRVSIMLDFLMSRNAHYMTSGVAYSPSNLADLYPESVDEAVPVAIEICCLPDAPSATPDGYADRGDSSSRGLDVEIDDGSIVVEAVGYTVGENTPQDQRKMKAAAVTWCLDKKNFVKMQSGSKFISDRDPGLLTFTFPAMDPWGIGGFHHPDR
ncbi:hypothetical protein B0H15DRAFT_763587, partial [Mycena belliarum]